MEQAEGMAAQPAAVPGALTRKYSGGGIGGDAVSLGDLGSWRRGWLFIVLVPRNRSHSSAV
jgi:hypothetical protein